MTTLPPPALNLRRRGPLRATIMRLNDSDRARRQIVALTVESDDLSGSRSLGGWDRTVLKYS